MANEKTPTLEPEVKARLDKMDWARLEKATGVKRETVEKSPFIASQLAYGQVTHPVHGYTDDVDGNYCLRAIPGKGENDPWTIKAYTIKEGMKKNQDGTWPDIPFAGGFITSDSIKDALMERTTWKGKDGQTVNGLANANAGRQVAVQRKDKETGELLPKEYYIASYHPQSNRVFGVPVDAVRNMMLDENGHSKVKVFGVQLTDDQAKSLAEGKAVYRKDWKGQDGNTFDGAIQFDACQRKAVICHPTALKEAQRMGYGTEQVQEQKPAETTRRRQAPKAQAPAEKRETKLKR